MSASVTEYHATKFSAMLTSQFHRMVSSLSTTYPDTVTQIRMIVILPIFLFNKKKKKKKKKKREGNVTQSHTQRAMTS